MENSLKIHSGVSFSSKNSKMASVQVLMWALSSFTRGNRQDRAARNRSFCRTSGSVGSVEAVERGKRADRSLRSSAGPREEEQGLKISLCGFSRLARAAALGSATVPSHLDPESSRRSEAKGRFSPPHISPGNRPTKHDVSGSFPPFGSLGPPSPGLWCHDWTPTGVFSCVRSIPSVFINPEDPDAVELGQLGDQHGQQGDGVDRKMDAVVFGVEAGQDVPEDRRQERREAPGQSPRVRGRSHLPLLESHFQASPWLRDTPRPLPPNRAPPPRTMSSSGDGGDTYSTMGVMVRNFRDAVNCTP